MASRSSVVNHFEIPERTEGNYKARCKYCFAFISARGNTTSNLLTHLKRKHPMQLSKPRQTLVTNRITTFLAGTLQQPSLVETKEFKELLHALEPNIAIPSREQVCATLIPDMSFEIYEILLGCLGETEDLALTLDIQSGEGMRNYLSITAHFISNWKLQNALLVCRRFRSRLTAGIILTQYEEITNNFGIAGKVTNIIADNSSNMVKTFQLPGYDNRRTGLSGQQQLSDSDSEDECRVSCGGSDGELFEFLPKYQSCFAHTLQLVVQDGMSQTGSLTEAIYKASAIISHLQRSVTANENFADFNEVLTRNATRWSSELAMIEAILDIPQCVIDGLDSSYKLSSGERSLLKGLCDILSPFQSASEFTQGVQVITSGFVIPCIRGLKAQLAQMKTVYGDNVTLSNVVNVFVQSINKRFSEFEDSEAFKMAAVLDPRFKSAWCRDEELQSLRRLLQDELASRLSELNTTRYSQSSSAPESGVPMKRRKLFSFMCNRSIVDSVSQSNSTAEERVENYLLEPCQSEEIDPLKYWEMRSLSMPVLAKLAKKYLVIPATSTPVRQLFKATETDVNPDRSDLTGKIFEASMFIKCNKHFHS